MDPTPQIILPRKTRPSSGLTWLRGRWWAEYTATEEVKRGRKIVTAKRRRRKALVVTDSGPEGLKNAMFLRDALHRRWLREGAVYSLPPGKVPTTGRKRKK